MIASQNSPPKATTGERERNHGKEKTLGGTRRKRKTKKKRKKISKNSESHKKSAG